MKYSSNFTFTTITYSSRFSSLNESNTAEGEVSRETGLGQLERSGC